jgi:hypothetical protein
MRSDWRHVRPSLRHDAVDVVDDGMIAPEARRAAGARLLPRILWPKNGHHKRRTAVGAVRWHALAGSASRPVGLPARRDR